MAICALTILVSHASEETGAEKVKQLRWVESADPISDAKRSIENGNFALLGIAGYTVTIPGVDESKKFEYREKYGLRILEGTSDVVHGTEHLRLIRLAKGYAKKYNLYMLNYMGGNGGPSPHSLTQKKRLEARE